MSKFVLSCGHEVDDLDHAYNVMTKAVDREGNKAIAYKIVCGPCEDQYRRHGEIFDYQEVAELWLTTKNW